MLMDERFFYAEYPQTNLCTEEQTTSNNMDLSKKTQEKQKKNCFKLLSLRIISYYGLFSLSDQKVIVDE